MRQRWRHQYPAPQLRSSVRFYNRKTGIHFIQRDIGGGINRFGVNPASPSINESAIEKHAAVLRQSVLQGWFLFRLQNAC